MADVVCLGELLIDFVPTITPTTLIDAPAFQKAPGGAPANVACGLARLGTPAAFMGKTGDDPFGHFLARTLAEAGVDTRPLRYTGEARTALAFVSLKPDGDREFMFYRHPSADMLFEPEEVDGGALDAARFFHYGSISLINEPSRSATRHAIDVARARGCRLSCDPNLRLALWPDAAAARAGLLEAIAAAEIVKLSEDEVEFLTGSTDPRAARERLWGARTELMTVTRGHQGCIYFTIEHDGEVGTRAVEAVDTTGAGDAFVAALLHRLVRDPGAVGDPERLYEICRFACAAGTLATTERGAISALPTEDRIEDLSTGKRVSLSLSRIRLATACRSCGSATRNCGTGSRAGGVPQDRRWRWPPAGRCGAGRCGARDGVRRTFEGCAPWQDRMRSGFSRPWNWTTGISAPPPASRCRKARRPSALPGCPRTSTARWSATSSRTSRRPRRGGTTGPPAAPKRASGATTCCAP